MLMVRMFWNVGQIVCEGPVTFLDHSDVHHAHEPSER